MPLGEFWRRWHARRAARRWAIKTLFVLAVVALALYPRVWLLAPNVRHWSNLNALIDAHEPRLAPLQRAVESELTRRAAEYAASDGADPNAPVPPPATALYDAVETAVYRHIPYAFDWDTWGVMDYLPTLAETLEQAREDCDGRALVAASLLRRMGVDAQLATDLKHVWVITPQRELMGPGAGQKTMVSDEAGTRVALSAGTLANLGRGLAFGVAVFPLGRELLIVAALWLATLHPRSRPGRQWAGAALLLAGLLALRASGPAVLELAQAPWLAWGGLLLTVGGWLLTAWRGRVVAAPPASAPAVDAP
jgi:transglutaminase-like putative cysteine protease